MAPVRYGMVLLRTASGRTAPATSNARVMTCRPPGTANGYGTNHSHDGAAAGGEVPAQTRSAATTGTLAYCPCTRSEADTGYTPGLSCPHNGGINVAIGQAREVDEAGQAVGAASPTGSRVEAFWYDPYGEISGNTADISPIAHRITCPSRAGATCAGPRSLRQAIRPAPQRCKHNTTRHRRRSKPHEGKTPMAQAGAGWSRSIIPASSRTAPSSIASGQRAAGFMDGGQIIPGFEGGAGDGGRSEDRGDPSEEATGSTMRMR